LVLISIRDSYDVEVREQLEMFRVFEINRVFEITNFYDW